MYPIPFATAGLNNARKLCLSNYIVDTSMLEETKENKKSFKIVMLDSQESRVNRSQGLRKEKEGIFKNLGLVAAQCNGITACAYSLKLFPVHMLLYLTVHGR